MSLRVALILASLAATGLVAAGCHSVPADLPPDEALAAYEAALADGDAHRARAFLEAAADAGDLGALATLAEAHARGRLRVPSEVERETGLSYVGFVSFPGQASRAQRRYERVRDRLARSGDPEAEWAVASDLLDSFLPGSLTLSGDSPDVPPAALDSARAIYQRLVTTDLPRVRLALLARSVGDHAAYERHIDEAAAAGEPQGCWFREWFTGEKPDLLSTRGYVEHWDRLLTCDTSDGAREYVTHSLSNLRSQVAKGNAEAVVALDSVRALGFFRRHPDLSAPPDGA